MPGSGEGTGSPHLWSRVRKNSAGSAAIEDIAGVVVPGGATQARTKIN